MMLALSYTTTSEEGNPVRSVRKVNKELSAFAGFLHQIKMNTFISSECVLKTGVWISGHDNAKIKKILTLIAQS